MEKKESNPMHSNKIVNLTEARAKRSDAERRQVERFFLRDILQLFCVVHDKLLPIEFLDASEGGCSFRVPLDSKFESFKEGQELGLRLYFSRETYLLLGVRVVSATPMLDQEHKFMRYGCTADPTFSSYPAYQQLLKFIQAYSTNCRKEKEKSLG